MQKFNEDVIVNGVLSAVLLDGELSPKLETDVDNRIHDKVLPLLQELEVQSKRADAQASEINELKMRNAELVNRLNELADNYNKAIEVINDLSERVAALESNYDPTVIK